FVFFGVGSGNNSSLGDLFNNLFKGGSSGPSISSSLLKTQQNPADAKAWHDLATAYQDKQRTQDAVGALTTYTSLRPKDAKGLAELAALQRTQAQDLQQNVYVAQVLQQDANASSTFSLSSSSPLGKALNADPVSEAWQGETSSRSSGAQVQVQSAYAAAIGTYQRLAALRPGDASVQLDLATTAESAGNTTVEIAALKRAAKLLPDQAAQIRAKIKTLQGHK